MAGGVIDILNSSTLSTEMILPSKIFLFIPYSYTAVSVEMHENYNFSFLYLRNGTILNEGNARNVTARLWPNT
jgi:hypothetical protein